jgi:hypothetical protein
MDDGLHIFIRNRTMKPLATDLSGAGEVWGTEMVGVI